MKELELEFTGTGEVKGDTFKQLKMSPKAYLYERSDRDFKDFVLYEVFKRKETKESTTIIGGVEVHFEAKVKYPSSNDFGVWALCFRDYDKALDKFNEWTNEESTEISKGTV